ncbi:MAG: hypothetical protein LRY50_05365 [Geovibrio sp.]|nr:hypothetical protein [Geovibrio sp.]
MIKLVSELLKETYNICKTLFRIMIPVIIAVKVLSELGIIKILSAVLNPFMKFIGLPGELGLAWATALFTNIYGGIIVFVSLSDGLNLTVAQATIFASIVLIAHSMPVELQIMRKSGPRLRAMLVLRMGGAVVYGWLLNVIYSATGTLQEPLRILWAPPVRDNTLSAWAMGEVKNLFWITCIIFTLVVVMRILHALGLMKLMENLLGPVLRFLGVSARASTLTIFGLTIGLSYAGGMIINEAKSGKLSEEDIFFSISLLGLCHSLIEDTLLLMVVGGHLSGIFWGRIIFSLIIVILIQRIIRAMKPEFFHKMLFLPSKNS